MHVDKMTASPGKASTQQLAPINLDLINNSNSSFINNQQTTVHIFLCGFARLSRNDHCYAIELTGSADQMTHGQVHFSGESPLTL
jgi:hypothetical protein